MKAPIPWLREFVDAPSDPAAVGARLAACGFAVDAIDGDVVDFDVTANRPDCLSVYGLAREASAAFDVDLNAADAGPAFPAGPAPLPVSIDDPGCGRYALAVIDVSIRPSPDWLADRLTQAGVRPINNVVDVTNYVMIELGQPMHAFDAAKLAGPEIRVRRARSGESLTTIDGEKRALEASMLVIADRDRAIAVAGVMGGLDSEIAQATTSVALESAWFAPATVRATSRAFGLKTEASIRFERGADAGIAVRAIARALALLQQIGGGTIRGGVTDLYPNPPAPIVVTLRKARLAHILGVAVPDRDAMRILRRLGFEPVEVADGWRATAPSFRVDIAREIDLIEEVGRHWGLDRTPARFPPLTAMPRPADPGVERGRFVRRLLCGAGLQEAVTFTFVDEAAAAPFADETRRVAVKNPLSEKFAALRPSLAPGLAESLVYNRYRQAEDVRLFEVGAVFSADLGERETVGWVMTGSRVAHWSGASEPLGFTDAKGVADLIASAFGTDLTATVADDAPWLVTGQRARLAAPDGRRVGWVGRLAAPRGADDPVYAGEIDLAAVAEAGARTSAAIAPLPRVPSVVRDLSLIVDERLPAADVRGTIRSSAPVILASIREFDRYQGKGVPAGQVSLSVRLTFRAADRTLTDGEVQDAVAGIVAALERAHGATLRGAAPGRADAAPEP